MAFDRPSLSDIVTRVQADFVSQLDLDGAPLRRAMVRIMARVIAGAVHLLYGVLVYLARQLFPDLSDPDFLYRQASLYGIGPNAATYATGSIIALGTNGSTILSGALLRREDGVEYATTATVVVSGGTAIIPVTAVLAGSDGNADLGTSLVFESPVAGVAVQATAGTGGVGISGGNDVDTPEAVRARLLARYQDPPQGGSAADYRLWALEVSGVTRVWVYPLELGAGTVTVRFVRDNDTPTIIPDSGEVAAVAAHIATKKPATAAVTTLAPTAVPVNFNITLAPDTQPARDAVRAELADLFRTVGEPGSTLLLSDERTAIGVAAKAYGATYTMSSPSADQVFTANQIPTLGTFAGW